MKIKSFLATVLFLFLCLSANAAQMLDVDYNFIDTAFNGIKPVTDKQFNDAINRLTPQPVPDTFGGKLKTFLFGRKYGVDAPPTNFKEVNVDIGGEKKAIEDLRNGTYYIKLVVSLVSSQGSVIPLGNYKIMQRKVDNTDYLVFFQGAKEYGSLKLQKFEDDKKGENDLTYTRVDILNDDIVRIVYSTLEDTKCAYGRIYNDSYTSYLY